MSSQKKRRLLLAICAVAALGFVGVWRIANPVGPKPAPELVAQMTSPNLMPRNIFGGPPPAGTSWEVYSIRVPYPQLVQAMKREPGWRVVEGVDALGLRQTSFFATEAGTYRQIDIRPGRLLFVDQIRRPSRDTYRGYSVVTIAVPTNGTLKQSMLSYINRLLGRSSAPVASKRSAVFLRDSTYKVASSKPKP